MTSVIELPAVDWDDVRFSDVDVSFTDRMEGRRTETVRQGTSWWVATWRTVYLTREDLGRMDAWARRAKDGAVFRAHDPFRPRPLAEDTGQPLSGTRAGGGAFDGTATLFDIADSRNVEVSGLPVGFKFSEGDYVEFRMSPLTVSLHLVDQDATADAFGHALLNIRYGLDTQHFTTAATVNLEKPSCLMQIDPGSYDSPKTQRTRQPGFSSQEVFPNEP